MNSIKLNVVDRFINYVNPQKGLERVKAKTALSFMQSSGYITAGSNRNAVKSWKANSGNANQDTIPKLKKSRESSRDLTMNTPIARGAVLREARNAIGPGLILQSRIDRETLNLTPDEAEAWQRNTEKKFHNWAKSKKADFALDSNFYQQQWMVTFNTSLSGDVFAVLTTRVFKGKRQTSVKLIEADDVTNPLNKPETFGFAGGIELDPVTKEKIRIHVRKINNDAFINSNMDVTGLKTEPINIYSSGGRKQVFHIYRKERIGQIRGMPLFAAIVEILKNVSRLSEAELMAAVITSFFTVFIKTASPENSISPGTAIVSGESTGTAVNNTVSQALEMGSGNILELAERDQSIEIAEAKRPNGAFEPFFIAMVKQIGAAIEIPAEHLLLHFSSSYTAFRGAIQEAWKFYIGSRKFNVTEFSQPVYEDWLETEILEGRIVAPGFFENDEIRSAWCGSHWVGPAQGQVDPIKETQASELRIKNFLSTYEDEYASINGGDWEGALNRQARERRMVGKVIEDTYDLKSSKSKSHIDDDNVETSDVDQDKDKQE
jgi:lambda family phage portal protein